MLADSDIVGKITIESKYQAGAETVAAEPMMTAAP